ncbi:MAG: hypothetical protein ACKORK_04015 [Gemmatimonadota bacterium]
MEQLLPVLFILAAGLIDLIQRWQRRAKRPPLERESEPERSSPEIIFDLEEILRGTARPRKPAPPPARPMPKAPSARRAPAPPPAPEGPRGPRPVVQPVARAPHPVLHTLKRPADVRQAIVVSTILGRCPGME